MFEYSYLIVKKCNSWTSAGGLPSAYYFLSYFSAGGMKPAMSF